MSSSRDIRKRFGRFRKPFLLRVLLHPCLLAVLLAAPSVARADELLGPRPLTPAERQAVALAVAYFTDGPAAWWNALATDAPLRELGRDAALDEIRARVGPAAGTVWRLGVAAREAGPEVAVFALEHPSDFDDTIVLRLVEEDGGWKLASLRSRIDPVPDSAAGPSGKPVRMGALAPLRRALAEGRMPDVERLLADLPSDGPVAAVGRLWEAQLSLLEYRLDRAAELLHVDEKPRPGRPSPLPAIPLAALLRARLIQLRDDELGMSLAFDQALETGIEHDGLRLESLRAQGLSGFVDEAGYRSLFAMGTRFPEVYYTLARAAVYYEEERGEAWLRVAWQLGPKERKDILQDPFLARLCLEPGIAEMLRLDAAGEPLVAPRRSELPPLAFPDSARLLVSGDLLTVFLGGGEIEVPGGGALAPDGTPWEDAGSRQRRREEAALAELESLVEAARSPAAVTTYAVRERLETAAAALAARERWADLLRLTDGIASQAAKAGPVLGRLRAVALSKTSRVDEAVRLLSVLAHSAEATRRRDPSALHQLAELCVEHGRYDLAMDLVHRAEEMTPGFGRYQRGLQIELDQRLSLSHASYSSDHFVLVFPPEVSNAYVEHLAALLEAERQRLLKWIPAAAGRPIEVLLFPWDEFSRAYGSETLGLYDGKMRIPFVALAIAQVELDTVVTHELAHALIDRYAGEKVPAWLHEGLAQHVEPKQHTANPIPELAGKSRLLSLPVLEALLTGYSEPETVELAYLESLWWIHFLESRYRRPGLQSLLRGFSTGGELDDVLGRALQVSAADLDTAFRDWGLTQAPAEWTVEVPRYFQEEERKPSRDGLPKVGYELPEVDVDSMREEVDAHVAAMRDWYRRYSAAARPVKKLVVIVKGTMDGTVQAQLGPTCRELFAASLAILGDDANFNLPDSRTGDLLRQAYIHFRTAALACNQGNMSGLRVGLEKGEYQLGLATEVLGRYGLQP